MFDSLSPPDDVNIYRRIAVLVLGGFTILLALGLSTNLFLDQKLQQRVDDATAETLLLNQTRVRVREAQVVYMIMAQGIADLLLDPAPRNKLEWKLERVQKAHEHATMSIVMALAATENIELQKTLRKLLDHDRLVIRPLEDEIIQLAATDPRSAQHRYRYTYLPALATNTALINEAIRLSSEEVSSFNERANVEAARAQLISRITIILFVCIGVIIAVFLGRAVRRLITLMEKAARDNKDILELRRDINAAHISEKATFDEKERLRVTLSCIADGVITTDTAGNITYMNPVAEAMTGWMLKSAVDLPLLDVFHIVNTHTGEPSPNPVERVFKENQAVGLAQNTNLVQRGGVAYPIEDSAAPIRDRQGDIIGAVLVFHDVSYARKMASEMKHQASHDALTGLINRREFEQRLERSLQTGKEDAIEHTLLYLDLDQFKIVNDTCGHMAGDELLKQLSALLQAKLRKNDTLARLGGDEFGVLLESCPSGPSLRIAELLRQTVREFRFVWGDRIFTLGLSIGLVTFSNGGETLADILRMADSACFLAKDKGRDRVQIYTLDDTGLAQRHSEMGWVGRIQKALEEECFVLFRQKILPIVSNSVDGDHYEVLLRMKDEDGNLVPPMAFIPAAERYGLMPRLDRWVITTAFMQYKASPYVAACAINLSGASICDDGFYEFVVEQFDLHKVPPSRICFEITETSAVANLTQAAALIRKLKDLGCRFALDDFGSGMCSFAYLKHLPVDYLKIDGGFVKGMVDDPIDRAMVEAINHIGHVMQLKTIAEFVESDAILQALRKIGVDYAQGYGIEKPRLSGLGANFYP
ncbi:EAL domain-containing protein [Nitrosospira sp. Is2]|uniref:EAL domain-containing protein n=1 Tax=Nitrosospira sp. Is2 TaxID=3080532 RepID=UPI002955C368|nr:EAL domain-containing protein [Nitrosospira sp. Is2]WON75131.1 EAL domain-containing protein [Nitrosospira sp. Is2]